MNLSEHKFHVYSFAGILKNRVDYSDMIEKYGLPQSVSNNGRIFLFKPPKKNKLNVMVMTLD